LSPPQNRDLNLSPTQPYAQTWKREADKQCPLRFCLKLNLIFL